MVLVGPPASGKTELQRSHPEWVVVSKNDFRTSIFRSPYQAADEETVERVFAAALVETVGSDANVVCVDDLNLTREARSCLIEMARISGRRPIAHVMPVRSIEEHEERIRRNIKYLRQEHPHLRISGPSKHDLELLLASYARVSPAEGFYDVVTHEAAPSPEMEANPEDAKGTRTRKRIERREPLPIFV